MKPYFSVITPSFNQGAFLESCIRSVRSQNDPEFEHWIFDNCSTDDTAEVLEKHPHVKARIEPDRGQAHAVNKGLDAATGEIICWLNADDEYPPGTFATLRRVFSDPNIHVVFGDVRQVGYDGSEPVKAKGAFADRLDLVRWWRPDVKLHQPAVFFRQQVAGATGHLRQDLHYALDYEYWWRMSEAFPFHYVPDILAIQHRQPDSKTMLDWDKVLEERERIFAPHYGLLGYDPAALKRDRDRSLAELHTTRAFAAVSNSPRAAWRLFWKAASLRPTLLATTTPLSLLRRTLWSAAA